VKGGNNADIYIQTALPQHESGRQETGEKTVGRKKHHRGSRGGGGMGGKKGSLEKERRRNRRGVARGGE